MYDSDVMTYAVIGVSLLVSAIQGLRWFANADPRAVTKAGQLSAACLVGLTPVLLLGLALTGRSTLALMLGSLLLPLAIWGVPRWRAVFGAVTPRGDQEFNFRRWDRDFNAPITPDRSAGPRPITPDLVQQSLAVLTAYLEHAGHQGGTNALLTLAPKGLTHGTNGNGDSSGPSRRRMSTEEAFAILGLDSTASPDEINGAYNHLYQKFEPELGETHYLISKIREAKMALLLDE